MILEPITMSDEQNASVAIMASQGMLCSVDLLPPATGTATLKIYDHPSSASGRIIFECVVQSTGNSISVNFPQPRLALKGLYASLTGTTTFIVGYTIY